MKEVVACLLIGLAVPCAIIAACASLAAGVKVGLIILGVD